MTFIQTALNHPYHTDVPFRRIPLRIPQPVIIQCLFTVAIARHGKIMCYRENDAEKLLAGSKDGMRQVQQCRTDETMRLVYQLRRLHQSKVRQGFHHVVYASVTVVSGTSLTEIERIFRSPAIDELTLTLAAT